MTISANKPVTLEKAVRRSEEMAQGATLFFQNQYKGKTDAELSAIAEKSPFELYMIEEFLGRKLNATWYWNFPEYQYEGQGEDLRFGRETKNDKNLSALGWKKENNHIFSKKTCYTNILGDETPLRLFVKMFPEKNDVYFWTTNNIISLHLTWDEMYNLIQLGRERGFEKPVFVENNFIRIENEDFWEVPDYRYYNMGSTETSKRNSGGVSGFFSPHELIFSASKEWTIVEEKRNTYKKNNGNNVYIVKIAYHGPTINKWDEEQDGILLCNHGYIYGIPFDEFVALFQKGRELGFKKPETWRTYEATYPDKGNLSELGIWWNSY